MGNPQAMGNLQAVGNTGFGRELPILSVIVRHLLFDSWSQR